MMVDLTGKRCLIVGGGVVAERKVARLLECGAAVEVVSPAVTSRLKALASSGRLRLRRRPIRPSDFEGAFLVFVTTNDPEVNRRAAEVARRHGGLVNVADDPATCSFHVPSVVRRGDLAIAISTGGGSPALAKKLRQRLEQSIGPEYTALLGALRALRERAQQTIPDPKARQAIYRRAVESDLYDRAAAGDSTAVRARIDELIREASDPPPTSTAVVGTA
jgi:precorrin-2 dehydrogenase/sirohydrochlorin ferrochelatase